MSAFASDRGMRRLITLACCLLWAAGVCAVPSLRWEIASHEYTDVTAATRAVLHLELDGLTLPASGWALYFNCASELKLGELPGGLHAEHAGGTLYRVRPAEGFRPPLNGTLNIAIEHPEVVIKASRAPTGPYLVFDDHPDQPIALRDYRVLPPSRPEHWPRDLPGHATLVTAEDRYAANQSVTALQEGFFPPVLPTPRQLTRFAAHPIAGCAFDITAVPELAPEVAEVRRLAPAPAGCRQGVLPVTLSIDPDITLPGAEAYRLQIKRGGIEIRGRTPAAIARAVASLRQLMQVDTVHGVFRVPSLMITDAPRFSYRGLHVDVARNFQRKETVFHLIDLMARHKLNTLHLHLTDDEGWRLEIPGLPELTSVGATRGHRADALAMLPPAHGSGPDPEDPHGSGFYTADDYMAILRYAAGKRIEVIPEIEMPGHARAAVIAMRARERRLKAAGDLKADEFRLADPADQSRYVSAQGFDDNVMNPALESTYRFIDLVIDTVADLHRRADMPLRTLHVGGDELPRGAWTDSPAVQELMRREHLSDRQAVWNHFYTRVAKRVLANGAAVAGWEEIGARRATDGVHLEPNPEFASRGFTTYVWNDLEGAEDLGIQLANAGYPTVLAPVTAYYFDMVHNANAEEPGATWAPPLGLEAAFDFDPTDYARQLPGEGAGRARLSTAGKARILGLEGTLWSETMREPAQIEYLLLPRMLGLAERAWAERPDWAAHQADDPARYRAAWSIFLNQVGKVALPALDVDRAAAYRLPPPGLHREGGHIVANVEIPGLTLRFTTDGSEPTPHSPVVAGQLPAVPGLRVATFDRNGRRSFVASLP
jgi:hexosaminidase